MNINIEIGSVVLDGVKFTESQAFELRQALQSELVDLVATHSEFGSGSRSASIDATQVGSTANSSPRKLAFGLARSIGQSLPTQQLDRTQYVIPLAN